MKTIKLFTVIFCGLFLCVNISFSQKPQEQKIGIKDALSSGVIKLSITGIEDGLKLSIKVDKINDAPLILLIPKDTTNLKIGSSNYQEIKISTQKEIKIDLSTLKTQTVIVNQASKQKLIKGSIIIESNSGSTTYDYQNAMVGVK